MIRQIIGVVAEFERDNIVMRLKSARQKIREQRGRCGGNVPYGQHPVDAAAIAAVRRLSKKRRGASLAQIAATLDAAGVRTRSGRGWSRASVHMILKRFGRDVAKGGTP